MGAFSVAAVVAAEFLVNGPKDFARNAPLNEREGDDTLGSPGTVESVRRLEKEQVA